MTIEEVLTYIEGLPPFIPRKVARGDLLFNLNTISELLDRLGNPQDSLRCIHVAGTNGKGSVSTYIASVLQEGGIKNYLVRFIQDHYLYQIKYYYHMNRCLDFRGA